MTLLMSLVGMITLVIIALIFSYDRKSIRLRTVLGAFAFLFGGLADVENVGFVFAIKVLPVIIFFSSLIAVLYHIGIMQWVIRILGGALQKALGTSRTESLSATANIFVGQTEAPLVVRPFIARMTIATVSPRWKKILRRWKISLPTYWTLQPRAPHQA